MNKTMLLIGAALLVWYFFLRKSAPKPLGPVYGPSLEGAFVGRGEPIGVNADGSFIYG